MIQGQAEPLPVQQHTTIATPGGPEMKETRKDLWIRLGMVADDLGELQQLIFCFENALSCDPFCYIALDALSLAYERIGSYNRAMGFLQRMLTLNPDDAPGWVRLGQCCLMLEDYSGAYTSYHKAITLGESESTLLWFGIARLSHVYGSLLEAQKAYNRVLKDETFHMIKAARFGLCVALKQMSHFEDALKLLQKVAQELPASVSMEEVQIERAHILEVSGDINNAIAGYSELAKGPSKVQTLALMKMGNVYLQHPEISADHVQLAIDAFKKSLAINPASGKTWHLLGIAYIVVHNFKDAYDSLQQAIYKDVTNVQYWCSVGMLFSELHQYKDALDAYSRAIRLNKTSSRAWFLLGQLYQTCNQFSDALDALSHALRLEPNNIKMKNALQALSKKRSEAEPASTLAQFASFATEAKRQKRAEV